MLTIAVCIIADFLSNQFAMWLGGKRQEATSPSSMQVGAIPSIKMALDKGAKSVVLMSFCLRGDTAGSEVQHFSLFAFSTHMGIL